MYFSKSQYIVASLEEIDAQKVYDCQFFEPGF